MKRFVTYLIAASFAIFTVSAQSTLERDVERTKCSLDSLNSVLVETRNKYISDPELRDGLARQLVDMEAQALSLKKAYDKALAAYIGSEQRSYVRNSDNSSLALQQHNGEDTASVATVPTYP